MRRIGSARLTNEAQELNIKLTAAAQVNANLFAQVEALKIGRTEFQAPQIGTDG
jgi:hypothetical protein